MSSPADVAPPPFLRARERFGDLPDGTPVHRWTLTDPTGVSASILSHGAILQTLNLPDRDGHVANVVLGFDNLPDYLERSPFFGCVVGRYANRIAGGRFEIEGRSYQLPINDGPRPNTLHGGVPGFGARQWEGRVDAVDGGTALTLSRISRDDEEGFPGTLTVSLRYTLVDGRLTLDYRAETTAPTVVNLTSHAHFNLGGEASGDILGHEVGIDADAYLPVDAALIPLGGPVTVSGTPFDFRTPAAIGARLHDSHPQLATARGYDHCFVLRGGRTTASRPVATLRDPRSGRVLSLATSEPGVQLYTCNTFDGSLTGTGGRAYPAYAGVALETQHFPDSPNRPEYPSTLLRPGEVYRSTTVLGFTTDM